MDKTERKKIVVLTLVDDLVKLSKKSLANPKITKDPYSFGYVSGELKALEIMKKFIEEAWRR